MEIKLKSEFFKRIFDSEVIDTKEYENQETVSIAIFEDANIPMLKDVSVYEDVLNDYTNIITNIPNIYTISFNGLPDKLIKEMLKIGFPAKKMMIVNSEFDFSILDDINPDRFENIEGLHISNVKNKDEKKSRFGSAQNLKSLKYLNIYDSSALDIDSFFEDIPNTDDINSISISGNIPEIESAKRLRNVKSVSINDVKDPEKLCLFLENLPLEKLTVLSIINCDMSNISEALISRLSSLLALDLKSNSNVDYNKILMLLPSKDKLVSLELNRKIDDDNNINLNVSQLSKYSKLRNLSFFNFKLDFEALSEYLSEETELENLKITNAGVESLDFLSKARMALKVAIFEKKIDYRMLSSDIIRKHIRLELGQFCTNKKVITQYDRENLDDLDRISSVEFRIDAEDLDSIRQILSTVDKINDSLVTVSNDITPVEEILLSQTAKMKNGYSIDVSSFGVIGKDEVRRLNKDGKLTEIIVRDPKCDMMYNTERFSYKPEQYDTLKEKIEEITADIPKDLPDIKKFMIIYRRLGAKILYDHGIVGKNRYSKYAKDNLDDCRNCVNGLMRNTCVCAGYADILYNCLREVGIECHKISGLAGDYHQWNKVKIDGKMFNVDLTWDAPDIARYFLIAPMNCLKGDKTFGKLHKQQIGINDNCPENYSRIKAFEAMKFALEFDGIKLKSLLISAMKDVGKEIGGSFKDGIRIIKRYMKKTKYLPETTTVLSINNKEKNDKKQKGSVQSWDLRDNEESIKSKMLETYANEPRKENSNRGTMEIDCK